LRGLSDLDEIVVMDHGRVVERGRHDHLLSLGGWYASTWQREADVAELLVATAGQA